jgi:hypothetical protein
MTEQEKAKNKLKWNGASIARLKTTLRNDEHARLAREEGIHLPKFEDVKNIKPLSTKMQQWMPHQWRIYKQRKGQVHELPDST